MPLSSEPLLRALGVRQFAAVIFNHTVGSGIFVLPAVVAAQLGPAALMAYLVCAVIMTLVALCFAEAGSRVSASGGPSGYAEMAFGPMAGFLTGVLNVLSALAGAAAVASVFASSAIALLGLPSAIAASGLIVGVLFVVAAINIRGVTAGARLAETVAVAKLVPLVAFVVVGAAFVEGDNLRWSSVPSSAAVLQTVGVLIFAFAGIEAAVQPSGEVRAPARTVPRAIFLAMAAVAVLYLSIQIVAQGVLGGQLSVDRIAPLARAAATTVGPIGSTVMLIGATISMFGYLSGTVLGGPRSLFAFGVDGLAPRALGSVHARYRTPHVAIIVYAAAAAVLALSGSFERMLVLANVTALLVYAGVAVAAWQLRRRDVRTHGAPFLIPGGPIVPALSLAVNIGVLAFTVTWVEVAAVSVTLAIAAGFYLLRARGPAAGSGAESRASSVHG